MNRSLVVAAVVTGILCGVWAGIAPLLNLSIWAGFATCTSYFAFGQRGLSGAARTIITAAVGVLTALGMIVGSSLIGSGGLGIGIAVGAIVVVIVLMGAVKWLGYVPGIFVGCYSTFAMGVGGEEGLFGAPLWILLGSLVAGAVLGYLCDQGGHLVNQYLDRSAPAQPAAAPTSP